MGFEADDVAKLFHAQSRVAQVKHVMAKFSDQSKSEQLKILALHLKINSTLFIGPESLAKLEAAWNFSKGDANLEILVGISKCGLYKVQPFLRTGIFFCCFILTSDQCCHCGFNKIGENVIRIDRCI